MKKRPAPISAELHITEIERRLYICLGWIAAQHNIHPLDPRVLEPDFSQPWGDVMGRSL